MARMESYAINVSSGSSFPSGSYDANGSNGCYLVVMAPMTQIAPMDPMALMACLALMNEVTVVVLEGSDGF